MPRRRTNPIQEYRSVVPIPKHLPDEVIGQALEKLAELGYAQLQIIVTWEVGHPTGAFQDLFDLARELAGVEADLDGILGPGFHIPKPEAVST